MTFSNNSTDNIFGESPFLYQSKIDQKKQIQESLKISKLFDFDVLNTKAYHLLGVFASNFQIALFKIIEDLAKENNINSSDIRKFIMPIIKETFRNIEQENDLKSSLSGPVKRNDLKTISEHKDYLENFNDDYKNVYNLLTNILFKVQSYGINRRRLFATCFDCDFCGTTSIIVNVQ